MNRKVRKNYFRNKFEENWGKFKVFWDILCKVLFFKNNCIEIDKIVVDGKELIDKYDIVNFLNEYFIIIVFLLLVSW